MYVTHNVLSISLGTGVASMIACYKAGADIVDVATDALSGVTSQVNFIILIKLNSVKSINRNINSFSIET